jgi:uncharacterized protein YbaP (TraB family)
MKTRFFVAIATLCFSLQLLASWCPAQDDTAAAGKSFFWKVQGETGTAFILGSVHLAKPDIYPLPKKIEDGFANSKILAVEADPAKASDPALMQQMLASALYPGGDTLAQHISKTTLELAAAEMNRLGLPMEAFESTKPWVLAVTIEALEFQRLGYNPAYGIDNYFAGKASGKKRLVELESIDYQISLMNGFNEREQELFLIYTIRDLASLREGVGDLMHAWQKGDTKAMEALLNKSLTESPEIAPIYDKLFTRRNREMAEKIGQLLQGKETAFVVVGAAHLVGKTGIIELLRGKGFKIEQM